MHRLPLSLTTAVLLALLEHTASFNELDNYVQYFSAELDSSSGGVKSVCRLSSADTAEGCAADCAGRPDKCVHGFKYSPSAATKCCFYLCQGVGGCCPGMVPIDDGTAAYIVPGTLIELNDGTCVPVNPLTDTNAPVPAPAAAPVALPVSQPSTAASATAGECLTADECFGADMPIFETAVQTIIQERADALRTQLQDSYDAQIAALAAQILSLKDLAAEYYTSSTDSGPSPSDGPAAAPIPSPSVAGSQTPAPIVAPAPVTQPTKQVYNTRCYSDYNWANTACTQRPNKTKCEAFLRCPCTWDDNAQTCGADYAALQAGTP